MLRSILIGLDTPDHVGILTELGVRWARRFGATLEGLAIVDEPGIRAIEPLGSIGGAPGVNPVYYMGYENRMAEYRQRARELLAAFAGRCDESGVAHEEVTGVGSPHEVIGREAGARDLILMPLRSHFQFTAHEDEPDDGLVKRVLKDTPRPVVVVPETEPPDGPVAIAYDGSLQAERALSAFVATGLDGAGPVHVVSVDADPAEASRRAECACGYLTRHRGEATAHAIQSAAPPAVVILEEVRRLAPACWSWGPTASRSSASSSSARSPAASWPSARSRCCSTTEALAREPSHARPANDGPSRLLLVRRTSSGSAAHVQSRQPSWMAARLPGDRHGVESVDVDRSTGGGPGLGLVRRGRAGPPGAGRNPPLPEGVRRQAPQLGGSTGRGGRPRHHGRRCLPRLDQRRGGRPRRRRQAGLSLRRGQAHRDGEERAGGRGPQRRRAGRLAGAAGVRAKQLAPPPDPGRFLVEVVQGRT